MKTRLVVVSLVVLLSSSLLTSTAEGDAQDPNWATCYLVGTIHLTPGVAPPTFPAGGSWVFNDILVLCSGTLAGDAGMWASGGHGNSCGPQLVPVVASSFCGSFTMTGFETGAFGNQDCTASIGGPQAPAGVPVATGPWSWIDGSSFRGSVDFMDCTSSAPVIDVGFDQGFGVIAGTWEVDPTSANTGCIAPGTTPPIPAPTVWFCTVFVEAVMTIVQPPT